MNNAINPIVMRKSTKLVMTAPVNVPRTATTPWSAIALGLVAAILVAFVSSALPSWRHGRRPVVDALRASCSIPFLLQSVTDIQGAPRGAYWDGGITDYHLHLPYASMPKGLVLYPHFQAQVVPGWLDKPWKQRHRASAALDNLVVLSPRPEWVQTLPNGKLPDRKDFQSYGDDLSARQRVWRQALAQSQRLADEFAQFIANPVPDLIEPLV